MTCVQDFHDLHRIPVHNHVGWDDKLAGTVDLSGSAKAGVGCQLFYAVYNRLGDDARSVGIILPMRLTADSS